MRLIPRQPWTLTFLREWRPYISFRSVLRLRDYELRSGRGRQAEGRILELSMKSPVQGKVFLREVGSDILTFDEVIKRQVYGNILSRLERCETVIDLGANIGLASLYFAGHYPSCQLFAVEPNPDTYRMLTANLRELVENGRCRTLKAAVWGSEKALIADHSQAPEHYSAFSTKEANPEESATETMSGLPIREIIKNSGFTKIDLLKVDIEGAEVELFKGDVGWLHSVNSIAIEFHGDSRNESKFDEIMRDYKFHIYDQDPHTVVVVRSEKVGGR
jgi:FkbM family methyltransferase